MLLYYFFCSDIFFSGMALFWNWYSWDSFIVKRSATLTVYDGCFNIHIKYLILKNEKNAISETPFMLTLFWVCLPLENMSRKKCARAKRKSHLISFSVWNPNKNRVGDWVVKMERNNMKNKRENSFLVTWQKES